MRSMTSKTGEASRETRFAPRVVKSTAAEHEGACARASLRAVGERLLCGASVGEVCSAYLSLSHVSKQYSRNSMSAVDGRASAASSNCLCH
jgi:hypothetical protein